MEGLKTFLQNRRNLWITTIVISFMGLNGIATFYGRKYFPENFHPQEVSFLENYISFGFVVVMVGLLLALIISLIFLFDDF